MKCIVFILIIGFFLPIRPVWAEIYRYKDAGGVVRFTDNLADVPEKQRHGISVYETAPSQALSSEMVQPSGRNTTSDQNLKIPEKSLSGDSAVDYPHSEELLNDPSRIDHLLKIKTALDEENAQLMKESLALSEEMKTISGNDAVRAYNEKVIALNSRVDDYEKRRAAFQKEAAAFDAALKKRLAPPPPKPPQSSSP
jgi:hypothetical protein